MLDGYVKFYSYELESSSYKQIKMVRGCKELEEDGVECLLFSTSGERSKEIAPLKVFKEDFVQESIFDEYRELHNAHVEEDSYGEYLEFYVVEH